MNSKQWIERAYESFKADYEQVEDAILRSTWAARGRSGDCFHLELFPNGNWRVIWQVGNLYKSEGVVIRIPPLNDLDFDPDGDNHHFDNAVEFLDDSIEQLIEDMELWEIA